MVVGALSAKYFHLEARSLKALKLEGIPCVCVSFSLLLLVGFFDFFFYLAN